MIKILVVDDSLTIRKWIVELLDEHPEITVIGEAENGKDAISMAETLKPDVITMDMMMPLMTGIAATEYIMAHCPTRILIVSASLNRGELMKTYDALAAGAISVVDKPGGGVTTENWQQRLLDEVLLVARVPVVRHLKGRNRPRSNLHIPKTQSHKKFTGIVIGASTGGPKTVLDILKTLPADFPIPILCVIHISAAFSSTLPEWINMNVAINVSIAHHNETIKPKGQVYIAPPDYHMEILSNKIKLNQHPQVNFCRPAVDVLFESAVANWGAKTLGILLTGMGQDGAVGLKMIHDQKGLTIAQDEASCVVFGMPHRAIELNAVDQVLSPEEISQELIQLADLI